MAGEARITLTEGDYIQANRLWLTRYLLQRRTIIGNLVTIAVIAAIFAAIEWTGGSRDREIVRFAALGALLGCLGFFLCYGLSYVFLPTQARRLFHQSVTLGIPYLYRWSNEGLTYESDAANARHIWTDFHRWIDDPRMILVLLNERLFYAIPVSALTVAQADDLRAALAEHGPPRF